MTARAPKIHGTGEPWATIAWAVAAAAWTAEWASASARADQLADVVRVLQQINEAAKAGKEQK